MPRFSPWPPNGEWTCAASPASRTRPSRYVVDWRALSVNLVADVTAVTVTSTPDTARTLFSSSSSVIGASRSGGGPSNSTVSTRPGAGPCA
jgi:hypothetical protein